VASSKCSPSVKASWGINCRCSEDYRY
jgi:hypothetical protein